MRARIVGVSVALTVTLIAGAAWYISHSSNSRNALIPPGHLNTGTIELRNVKSGRGTFDITMGSISNYSTADITVVGVRPNIDSPNVRYRGAFLLSSCSPQSHGSILYEPPNRWSVAWYFPRSETKPPAPVLVVPQASLSKYKLPKDWWKHATPSNCPLQPAWIWELRIDILRPGDYLVRGYTVTYVQAGTTFVEQLPSPRFAFLFARPHSN